MVNIMYLTIPGFAIRDLYVNLGYLDEQGYVVHSGLERFTARFSGVFIRFRSLKAGLDLEFFPDKW